MNTTISTWRSRFVSGAYSVALALLFILLLRSLAVQITPPPLPMSEPYPDVSTEANCTEAGGRWVKVSNQRGDVMTKPVPVVLEEPADYSVCQGPLAFERERTAQEEQSRQTSLFVFAIGGALAVAAGVLWRTMPVMPAGFMLGGIAAFFVAGTQLWLLVPGLGRLITIAVLFVFLLGVGWYAFREQRSVVK